MASGLTENQTAILKRPIETAMTCIDQALKTGDTIYGQKAIEELDRAKRLAADYCENPTHDA